MSQKIAKQLRKLARTALWSSKIKGPERQYYMLNRIGGVKGTEKQARRAVRVVRRKYDRRAPTWAQRLEFKRTRLEAMIQGVKRLVWKNLGLAPVPA